jgi:hypothetical protein
VGLAESVLDVAAGVLNPALGLVEQTRGLLRAIAAHTTRRLLGAALALVAGTLQVILGPRIASAIVFLLC